jgi:hypothetical protein
MTNQNRGNRWILYSLCALFFTTGASLWETIIFTPVWTAGAPKSLSFLGTKGLHPAAFWFVAHSLSEVILILALVFNWKVNDRRMPLLAMVVLYAIVRIWTLAYFAPTFIEFQNFPFTPTVDEALTGRTLLWRNLNYVRTGLVVLLNVWMLIFFKKIYIPVNSKDSGET